MRPDRALKYPVSGMQEIWSTSFVFIKQTIKQNLKNTDIFYYQYNVYIFELIRQ